MTPFSLSPNRIQNVQVSSYNIPKTGCTSHVAGILTLKSPRALHIVTTKNLATKKNFTTPVFQKTPRIRNQSWWTKAYTRSRNCTPRESKQFAQQSRSEEFIPATVTFF